MATLNQARSRFTQLLGSVGEVGLHTQYPNEFEYYLVMFEVLDSRNFTVDTFVLPVMPQQISIVNTNITNIKQTQLGVVSLTTPTFIPIDISISGNFGRKFRFLLGGSLLLGAAFAFAPGITTAATLASNFLRRRSKRPAEFSKVIKNGYGCVKKLEQIHGYGTALDSYGQPYRILFYNLAFNANYVVESMSLKTTQSLQTNRIWQYDLSMKAVADASAVKDVRSTIRRTVRRAAIQRLIFQGAAEIKNAIRVGVAEERIGRRRNSTVGGSNTGLGRIGGGAAGFGGGDTESARDRQRERQFFETR